MKFVYPDIDCVFDTEIERINTIVIENPRLLCAMISDLQTQIAGGEGRAVLSTSGKRLSPEKQLEVLDRFIPLELNTKALISRITADLEKKALSDEYYPQTSALIGSVDAYLSTLAFDYPCDVAFTKVGIGAILKSAGAEIRDDYESLGEKLIDYFQLVNDLIGRKLFITVNLRSFFTAKEAQLFMKTVASHQFDVIMIESHEHQRLEEEKRLIIDADLCLIG